MEMEFTLAMALWYLGMGNREWGIKLHLFKIAHLHVHDCIFKHVL